MSEPLTSIEVNGIERTVRESLKARWQFTTLETEVVVRLLEMASGRAWEKEKAELLKQISTLEDKLEEALFAE